MNTDAATANEPEACANCGTVLVGPFCHACGQKRFVESDRSVGHLIHQFTHSLTDVDGRVWRTLRALLFHPGLLSREFMLGRRAHWLAPVSLFLAVSVVYFIAPLHGGDLTQQFNQQVPGSLRVRAMGPGDTVSPAARASTGPFYADWAARLVDARVAERDAAARKASDGAAGYSPHDYRVAYDAKTDDISKLVVVLHVPIAAIVLIALFWRRHVYYAEHVVVALHFFAFLMGLLALVSILGSTMERVLPAAWMPPDGVFDWTLRTWLPLYAVFALHRAYAVRWIWAIPAAVVFLASLVAINVFVYRPVQFFVTYLMT